MPPRKKPAGISNLIGKTIWAESKYDSIRIIGVLVSVDADYLGIDVNGRVFYFSKQVIRCIAEEVKDVSS